MTVPVAIVGAGPAGLACALELAEHGRDVVLIDDNLTAGGQYFRQLPTPYRASPNAKLKRDQRGFTALARVLTMPQVRYLPSTLVWGWADAQTLCYANAAGSGRMQTSAIVIATGAQETALPFPGWTLPGIMSAGGCLNLMKGHGMIPAGGIVVAGNGPLVLVAASSLIAAGADVVAVVEAQTDRHLMGAALTGLWAAPDVLRTGIGYRARIRWAGLRLRTNWMVCAAEGENRQGEYTLARVAIAPVGVDGRPVQARQRWIDAQTLVTGYGLRPGAEAARLLGCRMAVEPALNGLVPQRDANLCTSVAGVYAIGDGAGIGGAQVAMLEGQIAAHAILNRPVPHAIVARYRRLDAYRRTLNLAYRPRIPLVAADANTVICRCEALTLAQLQSHEQVPHASLDSVKIASRLGMGRCQGRQCLHVAATLLNLTDSERYPRVRPPLKPIPLDWIANDADAGSAHEPDEAHAITAASGSAPSSSTRSVHDPRGCA